MLRELKTRKAPLNIDAETFRKTGHVLIDQIAALLESHAERPVTKGDQPRQIRSVLGDHSLPADGKSVQSIMDNATSLLFEHSLFNGHPRFWGYITASAAPAGMLADLLAASINANVGANVLSPMATEIERQAIRWIAELVGYPKNCGGIFVSGGNMANITAFAAARKAKATWDIRKNGTGSRQMTVYCAKGTHTWISKAADIFGLGTNSIRWIDVNEQQQMNVKALEEQIVVDRKAGNYPFIVVGTAGSVGTGSVDPLEAIAAVCKRHDLWFHVDGAYGAPAAVVPETAPLFKGMEYADSIALDPHKWLYCPLEAGCTLVKDGRSLQEAFSFKPDYYNFDGSMDDPAMNFLDAGFQNSRGFRALKVWTVLQQAGRNGYIDMIREDMRLAKLLFNLALAQSELEAVSCHLSIATFRFVPKGFSNLADYLNKLNEEIVNRIQAGGQAFVSNAVVGGKYCLRACIVNFRTTESDIAALVDLVLSTGSAVHQELIKKIHNKALL
ncbi:cytochrome d ubiquinol oxidase subunit I [Cytophagales bacterium WSM2-2]|nr:cytochrome d ubiquinol oxidase subunit I [Cytophagales bacterium WSM2-2]